MAPQTGPPNRSFPGVSQPLHFDTTPDLLARIELERLKLARERLEFQKSHLDKIFEKRKQDQELAIKDLEALEEKKEVVELEGEQKLLRIKKLETEMEERNTARELAMGDYLADKREREEVNFDVVRTRVARLMKNREKWTSILINSAEASQGAIRSGRGLNILLETLGPVAEEHQYAIRELQNDIDRLEETIRLKKQLPAIGEAMTDDERNLYQKRQALEMIEGLQGRDVLSERDLSRLRFKMGDSNKAISLKTNEPPLHVNWSVFENLEGLDCAQQKETIEICKKDALRELQENNHVSSETLHKLFHALELLSSRIEIHVIKHIDHLSSRDHQKRHYYGRVRPELKRLRRDFSILYSAKSMYDIQVTEKFLGKTTNELMAYMARNGLRFYYEPSGDDAARPTQEKIYKEMVRFFVGLKTIERAIEFGDFTDEIEREKAATAAEIQRLNQREEYLLDVKFKDIAITYPKEPTIWGTIADQAARTGTDILLRKLFGQNKRGERP